MTAIGHSQNITTTRLVEARAALIEVFTSAQKNLRIFLPDLSDSVFRDPQVVSILESIVLGKPNHKVEVILHNVHNLERDCARLMSVLRRHTDNFLIYQTMHAARNASDCLVLADDITSWHRLHYEHSKVVVVFNDKNTTAPLLNRFGEILDASEQVALTTVLGL